MPDPDDQRDEEQNVGTDPASQPQEGPDRRVVAPDRGEPREADEREENPDSE